MTLSAFREAWRQLIVRCGVAACWGYLTVLGLWGVLHWWVGDAIGLVGLVTALAQFLFVPLPLVVCVAWKTGRRELWLGAALGAALFLMLWGVDFRPKFPAPASSGLRVLTYNLLGSQGYTGPALAVLRAEEADVVCLQELTPNLAQAIRDGLSAMYPYQYLDPVAGVEGMGVLSKIPLRPRVHDLGAGWVGKPQVFKGDFDGRAFVLVNFHMPAFDLRSQVALTEGFLQRETRARALLGFVQAQDMPVILCGDANATPLSTAYRLLREGGLQDAWREAGWGFGNTFPGSLEPASSRPHVGRVPLLPRWSARIDYVLYTPAWRAVAAHTARFDGVSDHRGVWALLAWR